MGWWREPGVWIFIFAAAFIMMTIEWLKAHDIINRMKENNNNLVKEMRIKYWETVSNLETENENLKRKLGR